MDALKMPVDLYFLAYNADPYRDAILLPTFFLLYSCDPRDLHSFPTRRSSDLTFPRATWSTTRASCSTSPTSTGRSSGSKGRRSEEHTSELQSHVNLVCRLLLEKKNKTPRTAWPLWMEQSLFSSGPATPSTSSN